MDSKGLTMFLNQSVSFATTGSRVLDTCGSFRSSVYRIVRQNGLMYFKPKRGKLALEWGGGVVRVTLPAETFKDAKMPKSFYGGNSA